MIWKNGELVEIPGKTGCLSGDCKNGIGTFVYIKGGYQGEKEWVFSSSYIGEWKDGLRHGKGIWVMYDGNRYEGEFKNDKPSGTGLLTIKSTGEKIITGCEGNCINGYGKLQNVENIYDLSEPSYNTCSGNWLDGKLNGKGKCNYYTGDSYEGDFVNHKPQGNGTYTYADGRSHTRKRLPGKRKKKKERNRKITIGLFMVKYVQLVKGKELLMFLIK